MELDLNKDAATGTDFCPAVFEMDRMSGQLSSDDLLPDASDELGVRWGWAHDFAIDRGGDVWMAGKSDAIAAVEAVAITGSRSGGLWLINPDYDAIPQTESFPAEPLSLGWDNPDISCLVWESHEPRFLFIGCWALESCGCLRVAEFAPVLGGVQFLGQWSLPYLSAMGKINALVVLDDPHCLVAATDDGVWWSAIPTDPSAVNLYSWTQASGLPIAASVSLTRGPNKTVVTAGFGSALRFNFASGIFVGDWQNGQLVFHQATLPDPALSIGITSLSSCSNDRSVIFAVTDGGAGGGIGAVLRSGDGGENWAAVTIPVGAGNQGSYNNCIAVHPSDPQTVALGWRSGPFISTDGGQNWTLRPAHHSDLHTLIFVLPADGETWLYAGTDGGLALSRDLGLSWDSRYNKHLRNLEFYGQQLVPGDCWPFDVSPVVDGLFGGATQDNGNLWCMIDVPPAFAAFQQFDGGDGGTVAFLADGSAVRRNNTHLTPDKVEVGNRMRVAQWLQAPGSPGGFEGGEGTIIPAEGLPDGLPFPTFARVRQPSFRKNGRLVLAVAGKEKIVYALLEARGSEPMSFVRIADVGAAISCVASFDGSEILVGTAGNSIKQCDTATGAFTAQPVPTVGGFLLGHPSGVERIVWATADKRWAITSGRIAAWNGATWTLLTAGPSRSVLALDYDDDFAGGSMFAATDAGVLVSRDQGQSWRGIAAGLPVRAHGRDLRIVTESDERTWLYLACYGWGIWRTELPPPDSGGPVIPPITDEMVSILLGIIQDGGGVEIRGGGLHHVPPREPARELAAALLIAGLAARLEAPGAAALAQDAGAVARRIAAQSFAG